MKLFHDSTHRIADCGERFNLHPYAWDQFANRAECYIPGQDNLEHAPQDGRYLLPQYLATGDYHPNGLVGAANLVDWEELFPSETHEWWEEHSGHYGSRYVVIDLRRLDRMDLETIEQAHEVLAGLCDYPLINDETHTRLEMESQEQDWETWGRDDLLSEAKKVHTFTQGQEWLVDEFDKKEVDRAFHDTCEHLGRYMEGEGNNLHRPWDNSPEFVESFFALLCERLGVQFSEPAA